MFLGRLRYVTLTQQAEAMQTCPGFLKSLLECPGNLLEICSVKFVDTLLYHIA